MQIQFLCTALIVLLLAPAGFAQDTQLSEESKQAMEAYSELSLSISRLARDSSLAEEIELLPSQRKELLVLLEKHRMESRTTEVRSDPNAYVERVKKFAENVGKIISEKQSARLIELVEERRSQTPRVSFDRESMEEMMKLSRLMSELSRLSYDRGLAEELGITVEQKVDIGEIQREYRDARTKMREDNISYGSPEYNELMRELMTQAQEILTPEQSEVLVRSAKLKQLNSQYGDGFAMIIGLLEDFDLNPKQSAEIRDEIIEARTRYYSRVKELGEETLEEILREFPTKYRDEVRESVEGFIFKEPRRLPTPRRPSEPTSSRGE